jgi:hypothetical protein
MNKGWTLVDSYFAVVTPKRLKGWTLVDSYFAVVTPKRLKVCLEVET